jgi:hypothetical protein
VESGVLSTFSLFSITQIPPPINNTFLYFSDDMPYYAPTVIAVVEMHARTKVFWGWTKDKFRTWAEMLQMGRTDRKT